MNKYNVLWSTKILAVISSIRSMRSRKFAKISDLFIISMLGDIIYIFMVDRKKIMQRRNNKILFVRLIVNTRGQSATKYSEARCGALTCNLLSPLSGRCSTKLLLYYHPFEYINVLGNTASREKNLSWIGTLNVRSPCIYPPPPNPTPPLIRMLKINPIITWKKNQSDEIK